jgi:hypothetical protein
MSLPVVFLACLLAVPSPQQSRPPAGSETPPQPATNGSSPVSTGSGDGASGELPVSLDRIQRALSKPPAIRLLEPQGRNGRPVYRVDVEGAKVDIQSILGKDFLRGPVPYGAMTHQEFLDMVTPNDVKGFAPFSNTEGMIVAATSIALQWAVLKAVDKLKQAQDARARERARAEVEEALEALRRARRAAGLPDK